jgi:hypothetical protein
MAKTAVANSAIAKSALARSLALVLAACPICAAGTARAADYGASDICRLYGYAPRSADYRQCRNNARHYWSTGPCTRSDYALAHRDYCHLDQPPFFF